jgi:thiol-disulfide isomerase/thioredoxin
MIRRTLVAVLAAALLAGCAPAAEKDPTDLAREIGAKVDVDTPRLREIKAGAGIADCAPGDGTPVDGGLPDLTLPCLGGGPDVDLASLRGPMVVNLWAVWCTPCRRELPVLQQFHEKHAERVEVLGVNYNDTQPAKALELAKKSGVTYPQLADPAIRLDDNPPFPTLRGLPFLALVDADGKVVHQEFVVIESVGQIEDLVAEHLGVAP